MSKTLGQVNLLALNEAKDRGLTGLDAWQAAAEAVMRHELEHNDAARTYLAVIKRMSPVIEAVREHIRDSYRPPFQYDAERWDRLKAVVEALDSEEA